MLPSWPCWTSKPRSALSWTLIDPIHASGDDDPEHGGKTDVVDRLGPIFASHRIQGKEYIKQAFLPVIQSINLVHEAFEEDLSVRFLQGASIFDSKARQTEEAGWQEQEEVPAMYNEIKACRLCYATATSHFFFPTIKEALDTCFSRLDGLSAECDMLFRSFQGKVEKHGNKPFG